MTEKEFLKELETVKNENVIAKIKQHNLPVIIFGAGHMAARVSNALKSDNVVVSAYAVDEEYYKANQTFRELPIYNFAELAKKPEEYVFVFGMGMQSIRPFKNRSQFFKNNAVIKYELALRSRRSQTLNYDFILQNKDKFFETYTLLSDDFSRKTFMHYLKANITCNGEYINEVFAEDQYFNEITRSAVWGGGIYVDCGAYDGDTIENFINFANGKYKKIFAFEPDKENFQKLQSFVESSHYENITLCNCGVWDKKETLRFNSGKAVSSALSEDGGEIVNVDSIDNIVGNEQVTLIKMDVEGVERKALEGALQTLENSHPVLAISVYHRKEDLITIPQFLKEIYKNSKFYLRKHYDLTCYELVLYVVP